MQALSARYKIQESVIATYLEVRSLLFLTGFWVDGRHLCSQAYVFVRLLFRSLTLARDWEAIEDEKTVSSVAFKSHQSSCRTQLRGARVRGVPGFSPSFGHSLASLLLFPVPLRMAHPNIRDAVGTPCLDPLQRGMPVVHALIESAERRSERNRAPEPVRHSSNGCRSDYS